MKHIVLAVSYRAEMLEKEMKVEADRVSYVINVIYYNDYIQLLYNSCIINVCCIQCVCGNYGTLYFVVKLANLINCDY